MRVSGAAGALAASADPPWRWHQLLASPHRIGFVLALLVLAASGGWWALVQGGRLGRVPAAGYALAPALVHAAVMSFGFLPLFFGGFLFTTGPRWLAVSAPSARSLLPAFGAQAAGWLLWLLGAHAGRALALAGLLLAAIGLADLTRRFGALVGASRLPDRLHPTLLAIALAIGCGCLLALALALALGRDDAARAVVLSGLWGFVAAVFIAVGSRMIPFFSAGLALPALERRAPHAVLALMLAMAALEATAPWIEGWIGAAAGWLVLRGTAEALAGTLLLALALAWVRRKPLSTRLMVMLHVGFSWLGLSFALSGLGHLLSAVAGVTVLPLAGLHALTMGCFGSLMLAMVTRVSCGHQGRSNVADAITWSLFWLLQLAVLLRLAAAALPAAAPWLLALAAGLWAATLLGWGLRLANWLGRRRADGRDA